MRKLYRIILVIMFSIALISGVSAYVAHYLLEKSGQLNIVESSYAIEVYTDVALTEVASVISFPDVEKSLVDFVSTSQSYFMKPEGTSWVTVVWNCSGLPNGFTATGEFKWQTTGIWASWPQNEQLQIGNSFSEVRFIISGSSMEATLGLIEFNLNFYTGDYLS